MRSKKREENHTWEEKVLVITDAPDMLKWGLYRSLLDLTCKVLIGEKWDFMSVMYPSQISWVHRSGDSINQNWSIANPSAQIHTDAQIKIWCFWTTIIGPVTKLGTTLRSFNYSVRSARGCHRSFFRPVGCALFRNYESWSFLLPFSRSQLPWISRILIPH